MNRIFFACAACAAGLLMGTPATAQLASNTGSDYTVPTGGSTGSGVGGFYTPAQPAAPAGGGQAQGGGTPTASAQSAATVQVQAATAQVIAQLQSGAATTVGGGAVSGPALAAVGDVLQGTTPGAGTQMEQVLSTSGATGPVGELMSTLSGALDAGLGATVQAERMGQAIQLFNEVVRSSPDGFIANPPAEFQAIHAMLKAYTGAMTQAGAAAR